MSTWWPRHPVGSPATPAERTCCTIVPPYLLAALAMGDDPRLAARAARTLEHDSRVRVEREQPTPTVRAGADPDPDPAPGPAAGSGPHRTIYDAAHEMRLPGEVVRGGGADPSADVTVTEAYDGLGDTWSMYSAVFGRDSLDGKGLPLLASVHYSRDYDNAFWNGDQMVFGDGDGEVFGRFTASVEVVGHELTHGVTDYTAGLRYQGQPGALNESVSDVFGVLVKQRVLGQDAERADWLIGADLLLPGVGGIALRSMAAPGTAYDDPVLGKDPQPAHMDGYVRTSADNGGVHINSGIPNRAFHLVATTIGGPAWEAPGAIWYQVLSGGPIRADCDFATFAALTEAAAGELYGDGSAQQLAVRSAWREVGVTPAAAPATPAEMPTPPAGTPVPATRTPVPPTRTPVPPAGKHVPPTGAPVHPADIPESTGTPAVVTVRRSGGITGRTVECTVALDALPREQAQAWTSLLGGGLLQQFDQPPPSVPLPPSDQQPRSNRPPPSGRLPRVAHGGYPDAFSYQVLAGGLEVTVAEPDLPDDVRTLFRRTLRQT